LELFYGRYLSDTRIMFEEADNNNSFIASIWNTTKYHKYRTW
jgi:hypothetical protein